MWPVAGGKRSSLAQAELESRWVANFGLADLISLLHGKSLITSMAVERGSTERRLGWTCTDPSQVPNILSLLKCIHAWGEGGGWQRIGVQLPVLHSRQHHCSLLKASPKTSHSKLALPSPLCSSSTWGLQIQGAEEASAQTPAGKTQGDHPQLHHGALAKRCLHCFMPRRSRCAAENENKLPIPCVSNKLILLMLPKFSPRFLRSEVLQTPIQRG